MNRKNEHIQHWLRTQPDVAAQPPDALVEHVVGCAACRGTLLVLMTSLLGAPTPRGSSCKQCQQDLAPYIDAQIADGARWAVRVYPEVWWHLWTCLDCAEIYRLTLAIVSGKAVLPELSVVVEQLGQALVTTRVWLLELPRAILNLTFDPGPLLVPMGDDDDMSMVLLDREQDGYRMVLSVQPEDEGQWRALVEFYPPLAGTVNLELGLACYTETLDSQGQAQLHGLPSILLTALDGPRLRLRIDVC